MRDPLAERIEEVIGEHRHLGPILIGDTEDILESRISTVRLESIEKYDWRTIGARNSFRVGHQLGDHAGGKTTEQGSCKSKISVHVMN